MPESIRWDWIADHADDIRAETVQHLGIVTVSVAIAVAIALPVAVAVRRRPIPFAAVTATTGLLYTIPSLALFAFLVPVMGIGQGPVIVGLVLYSLLILVRNGVVGLRGVPAPVMEAAAGMGLTPRQRLLRVELPLALPAVVAGVRVATVSTVALVTVGALVGHGGFGSLILAGFTNNLYRTQITVGCLGCIVLAVSADLLLLGLQRRVTPWARRVEVVE